MTFDDGIEATIDFERWLEGPVFEAVKSPRYFGRFFLDGGGIVWPNGADIAPEALYEAALADRSHTRLHPLTAVRERRAKYQTGKRRRGRTAALDIAAEFRNPMLVVNDQHVLVCGCHELFPSSD